MGVETGRRASLKNSSRGSETRPRLPFWQKKGRLRVVRASLFPLGICRSPIHGSGIFAIESIPARQRVIEYTGQRISYAEAQRRWERLTRKRPAAGKLPPVYFFRLNHKRSIDGSVGGSGAEIINHSCAPNLRSRCIRGRIFYISRRVIRKGEELTLDYRFRRAAPIIKCHCGSSKCRGTINRK
jgi:SET domain-containing protein